MNQPNPAIVAQHSVRRLPRLALWLFCLAYVVPGFLGRDPWKSADMSAFGYMSAMAQGQTSWSRPELLGLPPAMDGLLAYWIGAAALVASPGWMPADLAVRLAFALLLGMTLLAVWYGVYYLARSPLAQPVAFAFGGEANAPDYARALADGGLLATIACLGLAQLSHETTPSAVQLCCLALSFYAFAAFPYAVWAPGLCALAGLVGLALSGAPVVATAWGASAWAIHLLDRPGPSRQPAQNQESLMRRHTAVSWALFVLVAGVVWLSTLMDLWRWRVEWPTVAGHNLDALSRLLLWFTWPAWPLALWSLWRWRWQLVQAFSGKMSRHLFLPLALLAIVMTSTFTNSSSDRSLLLGLPALAALAAFALPTLRRSVSALIDWFTLLFFSGCALTIWVVWLAMQTGVPPQPAANVARLAPGFQSSFSAVATLLAIAATLAWVWLVHWRVGRHQAAIWKSLVLPAAGAALCWLLLMTLWLPLLNFARGYTQLTGQISRVVQQAECLEAHALDRGQIAAFQHHLALRLRVAGGAQPCPWLLVDRDSLSKQPDSVDLTQWTPQYFGYRPTDRDDDVLLYRRRAQP
ncbi:MAG: hypothetical protein RLZZ126_741 [Pseudomonadota bacterium]